MRPLNRPMFRYGGPIKEGIMNGKTGIDFREKILSNGNSKPPDQLYRDFMGRDPQVEPLLVRSGLN